MRILIAEDQKDLNKILTKKLSAEGYSVDSCFDGQEALDLSLIHIFAVLCGPVRHHRLLE